MTGSRTLDDGPLGTTKYSVHEIDRMRRSVYSLMSSHGEWHESGNGCRSRTSWPPKHSEVEERLRTYMLAGTSVDELEAAALEHEK